MESLALHFTGPLSFAHGAECVFSSPLREVPCIYIWTIRSDRDEKYYVHYIGETTSFAARQREHLVQILGLNYGIFDPIKARQGQLEFIWHGLWRDLRNKRRSTKGKEAFYGGPAKALDQYRQGPTKVLDYVAALSVFVAKFDPDDQLLARLQSIAGWELPDTKLRRELRRHLEGKIGWNLRNNHPDACVLYVSDQHVGASVHPMSMVLELSSDQQIAGLDSSISI